MTPTPLLRPTLLPGLARVWRNPNTLQLGLDPARAVLIDLPDPRAARLLDLLDGSRSERAAVAAAANDGVPAGHARDLLRTLHDAGLVLAGSALLPAALTDDERRRLSGEAAALALRRISDPYQPATSRRAGPDELTPAQTLRRRAAARVVVTGRGRLGAGIAVALAQAGVRHVHPDLLGAVAAAELSGTPLRPGDAGRPRADAVADAVTRAAPGTRTHPVRRAAASLVIQLGYDQPVALLAAGHAGRRQPHLAVAVREGAAVIGPLVPATGRPCLNCVDLHRRERDAGRPPAGGQPDGCTLEPCAVATLLAATAYATAEALAFLDGRVPETLGAAVDITAPGRFRRRTWPPHPACGCAQRRRETTGLAIRKGANRANSDG